MAATTMTQQTIAAMWHRTTIEKAERIIIVTDAGQSLHFAMLFKAAEKVGYIDPAKVASRPRALWRRLGS